MTISRGLVLTVLLGAAAGCVDEAPKELDALLHYFWDEFESPTTTIGPAIDNLHLALGGEGLNRKEGTLKKLAQPAVDRVLTERSVDSGDASGFYMARTFACDFAQLEKISYWLDQKDLYDSAYEEYSREHTSSLEAYLARTTDTITWNSRYKTKIGVATFTADNRNTMRYLEHPTGPTPILLRRSWLPTKADASQGTFDQDYQLEIYYRRGDGLIVHAYADWRDMSVGGITDDQDFFASVMIDEMAKWDDKTEDLCEENRP